MVVVVVGVRTVAKVVDKLVGVVPSSSAARPRYFLAHLVANSSSDKCTTSIMISMRSDSGPETS